MCLTTLQKIKNLKGKFAFRENAYQYTIFQKSRLIKRAVGAGNRHGIVLHFGIVLCNAIVLVNVHYLV